MVDIGAALRRSLALGAAVMALTVLLSLSAGLAFRKKFVGADLLFYVTVASLIMPSIIVSLGIGLQFRLIDAALKWLLETRRRDRHARELHDLARHVHLRRSARISPGRCRSAC